MMWSMFLKHYWIDLSNQWDQELTSILVQSPNKRVNIELTKNQKLLKTGKNEN